MPSQDTFYPVTWNPGFAWSGRIRSWNNTPNFGALNDDDKPINGYSDERRAAFCGPFRLRRETDWFVDFDVLANDTWTGNDIYGTFLNYGLSRNRDLFAPFISPVENAVKLKALVKIADAKVNLAVTYAEAHKTSDLILSTAKRIDRAYRAFRRGNLREVANILNITPKKVHKTWLEYKYGWLPLLMDVKGAAEFFAQQHVIRKPRFVVVATEKVAKTFFDVIPYPPWGDTSYSASFNEFYTGSLEAKVKVWCELTSPHLSEMQQLGLTNPALVAWELVPYSFVFDWFIQVGDWLTGLTALQGVTVRRAMYSYVQTEAYSRSQPQTKRWDGARWYTYGAVQAGHTSRRYIRGPWTPDGSDLHPPMTNSFDFKKLVTSLALLRSGHRGDLRV